jgi:surface antigen
MITVGIGGSGRLRVAWLACVCAIVGIIAVALGAGSASASGPSGPTKSSAPVLPAITSAPSLVHGGERVMVSADVGQNSACRLTFSARRKVFAHSSYGAAASGNLEWVWTVPRRVRSGTSVATVSCSGDRHHASAKIRARGRRHGRAIARRISIIPLKATEAPGVSGLGGDSYPPYGAVLVPGSDWFGGHGVNVYSNGYGDNDDGQYQCVDLVTRFVAAEHFGPTIWGNANELYQDAPSAYYVHHPNGSGYIPVSGDIITLAGGPYGHVVIVDTVSGDQINVVEQNASSTGRSTLELDRANGYISGEYGLAVIGTLHAKANTNPPGSTGSSPPSSPPPTTTEPYVAPAGATPQAHQVYLSGNDGLYERNGPGTSYTEEGWLPNGANVEVTCQIQTASTVNGSGMWDLLTTGYFVSDYYVNTSVVGGYSPGIAHCVPPGSGTGTSPPPTSTETISASGAFEAPAGSTPQTYHVYGVGSGVLYERYAPSSSGATYGSLPNGATIKIACQTTGTMVNNTSDIWDLLTTGYFVSDYYVNTPDVGKYSPGIAQCGERG